ncbi:MAG: sigma-54-dependent Fis family transcriptional regulator [Nitrospiraceae bacterium]|nr:sigma-54-dependent Fis family transcriptional regulator [Nitrospiraceae bacterium]
MQQLFDMTALVADSVATVLIQGESGTGKEVLARTIHALSRRNEKPFIVVDCGALPETLLESELFGHVKGAFTGAVADKRGLFEEADGGTIFLDEIADTAPVFQAKLLRVLQEGEIKRVGGARSISVDVRVISAANKDLAELVKAKSFRQDLYYRLAVLPLFLPPLRERRDDIPLLVKHFVAVSCARHRQAVRHVAERTMRALCDAPWPGNVRELQHYIERAVVTTDGPSLSCEELVAIVAETEQESLRSASRGAVAQTERIRIVDALKKTAGNRLKAAKLLKISRASPAPETASACPSWTSSWAGAPGSGAPGAAKSRHGAACRSCWPRDWRAKRVECDSPLGRGRSRGCHCQLVRQCKRLSAS